MPWRARRRPASRPHPGPVAGLLVAGLALLVGCGDDGHTDRPAAQEATSGAADTAAAAVDPDTVMIDAAADTASAAAPSTPPLAGREVHHREAGFRIFWPAGFGEVRKQDSGGPTRDAQREFIFTCDRDGLRGSGFSVRCLRHAHGEEGAAPGARSVVGLVEEVLERFQVRAVRQRPLQDGPVQGVEVQAGEPAASGEVWIRGLLVGTDIYLLLAWDRAGNLFEAPGAAAFFASFRLDA